MAALHANRQQLNLLISESNRLHYVALHTRKIIKNRSKKKHTRAYEGNGRVLVCVCVCVLAVMEAVEEIGGDGVVY